MAEPTHSTFPSSSAPTNPTALERDPNGFVSNPPSVVVKVANTARDDINGLLGIVMSYNLERERYLVHMTKSQSTMAFRADNLVKSSMREQYVCQWQQLKNDPRVRQKMAHYMREMQHFVAPMRLSHVVGGISLLLVCLLYFVGFTKTLMALSMLALLGVMVGPDVAAKKSIPAIAQNFPNRARIVLIHTFPPLRGKVTNKIAVGIVLFMVALCLHTLILGGKSTAAAAALPPAARQTTEMRPDTFVLEKYYQMGFQDATSAKESGASLPAKAEMEEELTKLYGKAAARMTTIPQDSAIYSEEEYIYDPASTGSSSSSWFDSANTSSMTNAMSIFYVYRNVMDLGMDASTGFFSIGQLAANAQHLEIWRQGLLAMSIYRVLRIFL